MVQEWDESVLDIFLGELEMVSVNRHKLDLTSLVERLDTNVVILVESSSVQWKNSLTIFGEGLEPGTLLWIDDRVLLEHNKHCLVNIGEGSLSQFRELTGGLLVVQGWEESRSEDVVVVSLHVSEVSSWSKPVLGKAGVNNLLGHEVDNIAKNTGKAAWDSIDTHVWSSHSKDISDLTWHLTLLSHVSSEKTSLRKSHNIELTLEVWVRSNLLARFLGNGLEVIEDLSEGWDSDFNAVNLGVSSGSNHSINLNISWVNASISKSMEHGCWDSTSIWVSDELSSLLILNKIVEWGLMNLSVLSSLILFPLGEFVHVFLNEMHEWASLMLGILIVRHIGAI